MVNPDRRQGVETVRRVLIVDDHPLMVEIVHALLQKGFPEAEVHESNGLDAALAQVRRTPSFDLVVVDLGLPGCVGIEALTALGKTCPGAAMVVLSATDDCAVVRAALKAGARGYIPKSSPHKVMAAAIRLIAEGGVYVPPESLDATEAEPDFSERQLEVLRAMANGLSNRRIAKALGISANTVKHHAGALFKALGAGSRTEALIAARRRGIKLD